MKQELRKEIIKRRLEFSQEEIAASSAAVADRVRQLQEFQNAATVMTYLAFRNEIDTREIIETCWQQGKRVVIPVCQRETTTILPSAISSFSELKPGTWGIMEPMTEYLRPVSPEEIDLVLIPGVAFDEEGNRLGYGGGYYDRFLLRLRRDTVTAALAYEAQVLEDVYPQAHDQPMDLVITPSRIIECKKTAS